MNTQYIHQINNAINYIKEHLEEELDVNIIAKQCHLSKYYFNRMFKSVVGESVYSFVKRLRLERSAFLLKTSPDKTITDIGAQFNYSSSNFSSAFKQRYNFSPAGFRKRIGEKELLDNSIFYRDDLDLKDFSYYEERIKTIQLPTMRVLYKRYIGNYLDTSLYWHSFLEETKKLIKKDTLLFDISYDDPILTDENRCIYDICMTTEKDLDGFSSMTVYGGKYASYYFEGPNYKIFEAYQGILGTWLPYADITLDDRKMISLYQGVQKMNHIRMYICVPIQ